MVQEEMFLQNLEETESESKKAQEKSVQKKEEKK